MSLETLVQSLLHVAKSLGKPVRTMSRLEYFAHKDAVTKASRDFTEHGGWGAVKIAASALAKEVEYEPPTRFLDAEAYVFTWAQNNTDVHLPTLKALQRFCRENKAQLVVVPGRYGMGDHSLDKEWAPELHPYICAGRGTVGKHLLYCGDIDIAATAVNPLSGFEVFAGRYSTVFGHPKVQLQSVASETRMPRLLMTTGAVTVPNYTATKAGSKARPHHVQGGLYVERDGALFHSRHLTVDRDGAIYDLNRRYSAKRSARVRRCEALVLGDLHVDQLEHVTRSKVLPDLLKTLRPKRLVLHDVLDFDVRNHHRRGDLGDRIRRANPAGANNYHTDLVSAEVERAAYCVKELSLMVEETYIVRSNHDEAFDRWLNECNPHRDPINAPFYFQTWAAKSEAILNHETDFNPFEFWYNVYMARAKAHYKKPSTVVFVPRNEPLVVCGVALGFHGDKGINGSRGSLYQYARLGTRSIIGHSHTPGIRDGAMQVGVAASLDQGYNTTPSSWLNSHAVLYSNGKRALINVVDGRWRREEGR